jgi:hypothetical protein
MIFFIGLVDPLPDPGFAMMVFGKTLIPVISAIGNWEIHMKNAYGSLY